MSFELGGHMIYQNDRLDEPLRMEPFPFPVSTISVSGLRFLRFSRLRCVPQTNVIILKIIISMRRKKVFLGQNSQTFALNGFDYFRFRFAGF